MLDNRHLLSRSVKAWCWEQVITNTWHRGPQRRQQLGQVGFPLDLGDCPAERSRCCHNHDGVGCDLPEGHRRYCSSGAIVTVNYNNTIQVSSQRTYHSVNFVLNGALGSVNGFTGPD
jgi:hypothetical protein